MLATSSFLLADRSLLWEASDAPDEVAREQFVALGFDEPNQEHAGNWSQVIESQEVLATLDAIGESSALLFETAYGSTGETFVIETAQDSG